MKKLKNLSLKGRKKTFKGMTLMEIIISVAVMVLIALIIVVAGVSAVTNLRVARNVSRKNAEQAPFAAEKDGDKNGSINLVLNGAGSSGSLRVDTYEIKEHESADDRVGNYRYFETPVTTGP